MTENKRGLHHKLKYLKDNKGISQFYANKLNNLEEMNKFLEKHKPPKLTQEETDNLNNYITIKKLNFL